MDMLQHLHRLFAYNDWANRQALASLQKTDTPPARALKFMAHIVAAEWLWLSRLHQEKQKMAVWPEMTIDQCEAELAELAPRWLDYLNGLTLAQLSHPVTYTNTKGESFTNTIEDILMHVIMHSAYHRGQMATEVRAAGHAPAYTDFIHAVRQGLVE